MINSFLYRNFRPCILCTPHEQEPRVVEDAKGVRLGQFVDFLVRELEEDEVVCLHFFGGLRATPKSDDGPGPPA